MTEDKSNDYFQVVETGLEIKLSTQPITNHQEMIAGFYKVGTKQDGMSTRYLMLKNNNVKIPAHSMEIVKSNIDVKNIKEFFKPAAKEIFAGLSFPHKYGIILHGPQGTGKTTTCYALSKHLMSHYNVACITVTDLEELLFVNAFIRTIQEYRQGTLFVVIFDECEEVMYHKSAKIKSLLDSSDSVDNTLFLFTTNNLNQIPESIKNRPSRIKEVIDVGAITDEVFVSEIMLNINNSLPEKYRLETKLVHKLAYDLHHGNHGSDGRSKGNTLDTIKHAFLDKCLRHNLDKANVETELKELIQN